MPSVSPRTSTSSNRRTLAMTSATALLLTTGMSVVVAPLVAPAAAAPRTGQKVVVCHWVPAHAGSYVRVEIDASGLSGHGDHENDLVGPIGDLSVSCDDLSDRNDDERDGDEGSDRSDDEGSNEEGSTEEGSDASHEDGDDTTPSEPTDPGTPSEPTDPGGRAGTTEPADPPVPDAPALGDTDVVTPEAPEAPAGDPAGTEAPAADDTTSALGTGSNADAAGVAPATLARTGSPAATLALLGGGLVLGGALVLVAGRRRHES